MKNRPLPPVLKPSPVRVVVCPRGDVCGWIDQPILRRLPL